MAFGFHAIFEKDGICQTRGLVVLPVVKKVVTPVVILPVVEKLAAPVVTTAATTVTTGLGMGIVAVAAVAVATLGPALVGGSPADEPDEPDGPEISEDRYEIDFFSCYRDIFCQPHHRLSESDARPGGGLFNAVHACVKEKTPDFFNPDHVIKCRNLRSWNADIMEYSRGKMDIPMFGGTVETTFHKYIVLSAWYSGRREGHPDKDTRARCSILDQGGRHHQSD